MKALISNFRGGRHTKSNNQMILIVEGSKDKESAGKLIGKVVTWQSPAGKEIKGKVTGAHGNSGAVKVIFERGMPGQAIGQQVMME